MQWLRSWFFQLLSTEESMTNEQFRVEVQRILQDERKVTDVSFTPLGDVEVVHFWDGGVRAQFSLSKKSIKDRQQLALVVKAHAQSAFESSVKVAIASQEPPAPAVEAPKPDDSEAVREEALAALREKNITDVAIEELPGGSEKASFWIDGKREEVALDEDWSNAVEELKPVEVVDEKPVDVVVDEKSVDVVVEPALGDGGKG